MIAIPSSGNSALSYMMDIGTSGSSTTATVQDNYLDVSGAYGAFYPSVTSSTSTTYSNNVNMLNGLIFLAP